MARAKAIYTTGIASNSHLYNGVEFKDYDIHNYDIGYPFFFSDDWLLGSINYDGQFHQDVYILFDLVRDKVVVEPTLGHFKLELISEKITSFTLQDHHFVRLLFDRQNKLSAGTGFYDLLYNGDVKVYVKRKKEIQRALVSKVEITEYRERDKYFIFKNGEFYQVKSKASILNVFQDRKFMLRKYLAKNKIKFGKNREFALSQSAKFYDESKSQL